MSLPNRATTPDEAQRLRAAGFRKSSLESLPGPDGEWVHWRHPEWMAPNAPHLGPDEALRLLDANAAKLRSRAATFEESLTLAAAGFLVSPHHANRNDWFHRDDPRAFRGPDAPTYYTTDRALEIAARRTAARV